MLLGAGAAAILTAALTTALSRAGRIAEDAALGVVFTTLFAIGVILITFTAASVDLDPGCVLYGVIEMTPLDTVSVGNVQMPRAFVGLALTLVVCTIVVTVFFKELKIVSFDPALATTMGISASLVHYTLMSMVAATTVASFEAVGSILVVAMLVAPGATAHLLTDRLGRMVVIAAFVGILSALLGYAGAIFLNTSVAGMMSVAAGLLFAFAAIFAPRHGALSRLLTRARLALRITTEDLLGMLYRAGEAPTPPNALARPLTAAHAAAALRQPLLARAALLLLHIRGLVSTSATRGLVLTPQGAGLGRQVVRSHRLWETYLARHFNLPADHLHEPAHRAEHFVRGTLEQQIATEVAVSTDPHGRSIPAP